MGAEWRFKSEGVQARVICTTLPPVSYLHLHIRWTVTDTSLSPDQRFLIYSSITDVAHLVAVGSQYDSVVESISNVTEVCGKCGRCLMACGV